jgi:hypothetical protein
VRHRIIFRRASLRQALIATRSSLPLRPGRRAGRAVVYFQEKLGRGRCCHCRLRNDASACGCLGTKRGYLGCKVRPRQCPARPERELHHHGE